MAAATKRFGQWQNYITLILRNGGGDGGGGRSVHFIAAFYIERPRARATTTEPHFMMHLVKFHFFRAHNKQKKNVLFSLRASFSAF